MPRRKQGGIMKSFNMTIVVRFLLSAKFLRFFLVSKEFALYTG